MISNLQKKIRLIACIFLILEVLVFSFILNIFLLFTVPAMAVPLGMATPAMPIFDFSHYETKLRMENLHYDDVLHLIEVIECGALENQCTPDQLAEIIGLLTVFAEKGIPQSDIIESALLQKDIYILAEEMASSQFSFAHGLDACYDVHPAIYHSSDVDFEVCKKHRNWLGKTCHSVGKFVKKHKTAIIIGASIAVAATGIGIAIVYLGAGSTAAAVGAAIAPFSSEQEKTPTPFASQPNTNQEPLQSHDVCIKTPAPEMIQYIFTENAETMKTTLYQNAPLDQSDVITHFSWAEKARECGSILAHETLDAAADLIEPIPQFFCQIKEFGSKILPNDSKTSELDIINVDPLEAYQKNVASLHNKFDEIFDTDYADRYTPESKANAPENILQFGILPPPGLLNGIFGDTQALSAAGQIFDRAGFTRAGRALMKHGYRPGSVFPKPMGNPSQVNEFGQRILEEIVNDSRAVKQSNRLGGIDIFSASGRGARYDSNGNFIGFLEPPRN